MAGNTRTVTAENGAEYEKMVPADNDEPNPDLLHKGGESDLFADSPHPTVPGQVKTRGNTVKCPWCEMYAHVGAYAESPTECDKCGEKFNVPGRMG